METFSERPDNATSHLKKSKEVKRKVLNLEIEIGIEELELRVAPSVAPGQLGYEGQPGNQGNGLKGYEGQPGNQGSH